MKQNESTPNWLTYTSHSTELKLPCVSVDIQNIPSIPILEQVEIICIFIAKHQADNPLGLFEHPIKEIETQLRFICCEITYQQKAINLIETMYEYCNNPLHLQFDICRAEGLSAELKKLIARQQKTFAEGGLVADDRGDPSCLISPIDTNH